MSLQDTWETHKAPVLPPAADRFSGTVHSDCVRRSASFEKIFEAYIAPGGTNTGTVKLQVEVCSSSGGANPTPVPFRYRKTGNGNDTWTDLTEVVAADGVTTIANEEAIYELVIDEREINQVLDLKAATNVHGYDWIRVTGTEVVNDPLFGAIVCELVKLKTEEKTHATVMS